MSKQGIRQSTRQQRRREEHGRREEEQRRASRMRRIIVVGAIAGVVLVAAFLVYFASRQSQSPANAAYPAVDKIACDQLEQTAFHIHAHMSIYIDGKPMPAPANTGIAPDRSCFYWLHTHADDGIIHIEAPSGRSFILGNYLDIWENRFSQLGYPYQLDQTEGWQVYVNGKPFTGDFHTILLKAHTLITLAYNSPGVRPDTSYNWNGL